MAKLMTAAYGAAVYVLFLFTFLYAIAFVGNLEIAPKTIDSGVAAPWLEAVLINAGLLAVFALQHSIMARPAFKRWWTRVVPHAIERTTYVLFASLALVLLYWQWRALPAPVWSVADPAARAALQAGFWLGWSLVLVSTFLINHFELFGLQQVVARLRNRTVPAPTFRTPAFYRYVRHPIYVGFLIAFWSAPDMSVGRLVFALATTGYVLVGIRLEERDLIDLFGDRYRLYRAQVGMLLPRVTRLFTAVSSTERR